VEEIIMEIPQHLHPLTLGEVQVLLVLYSGEGGECPDEAVAMLVAKSLAWESGEDYVLLSSLGRLLAGEIREWLEGVKS
jgi:hypothetical protein